MATDKKQVEIPGRLHSVATEGIVAGANEILDDNKGKNQQEINASVDDSLQENKINIANEITRATNAENAIKGGSSKSIQNLDSRLSTVEAHDTISMEGGSVVVGTAEDFTNRTTAGDAKIPTVGAILNAADEEPTAGSDNLVKSGGVDKKIGKINDVIYGDYKYSDLKLLYLVNKYYNTNPIDKVKIDTSSFSNIKCVRIECQEGDKFRIFGKGLTTSNSIVGKLYTFSDGLAIDGFYTSLLKADDKLDTRTDGIEVTAPANTAYLSVNFYEYDETIDKIQKWEKVNNGINGAVDEIKTIVNTLDTEINGIKDYQEVALDLQSDKYYNTGDNPIAKVPGTYQGTACVRVDIQKDEVFKIYGKGGGSVLKLWCITDFQRHPLRKSGSNVNTRIDGEILTIEEGEAYLYINYNEYDSDKDRLEKYTSVSEGIIDDIDELKNAQDALQPIKDKNIVIFGDSISEFKYNGKGWSDWAALISGGNFINCAVGGTQLRQRRELITLFDTSKTYNIGDWVFYKPSLSMNCYECIHEHSGIWSDDDFKEIPKNSSGTYSYYIYSPFDIINIISAVCDTSIETYSNRFANQEAAAECIKTHQSDDNTAIIERLKSINWEIVDAIIIFAGINDFNDLFYGNTDSMNINRTYGAINGIIKLLSSTYGNIPIYYFSPIVNWHNYNNGSGTDENWCDNYIPNGGSITLRQFAQNCVAEFIKNHIPSFNLYETLGWNKWNFSNYFNQNDGTHPFKGFKQIAEKIINSVISNKVF